MLFVLGSILAGMLLYDVTRGVPRDKPDEEESVTYRVRSGKGEIRLPPCKLMAVELGPSDDPNEVILQIMVSDSVGGEVEPISDIGRESKYVRLTPTQYQTSIVLRTKRKGEVPITAHYQV